MKVFVVVLAALACANAQLTGRPSFLSNVDFGSFGARGNAVGGLKDRLQGLNLNSALEAVKGFVPAELGSNNGFESVSNLMAKYGDEAEMKAAFEQGLNDYNGAIANLKDFNWEEFRAQGEDRHAKAMEQMKAKFGNNGEMKAAFEKGMKDHNDAIAKLKIQRPPVFTKEELEKGYSTLTNNPLDRINGLRNDAAENYLAGLKNQFSQNFDLEGIKTRGNADVEKYLGGLKDLDLAALRAQGKASRDQFLEGLKTNIPQDLDFDKLSAKHAEILANIQENGAGHQARMDGLLNSNKASDFMGKFNMDSLLARANGVDLSAATSGLFNKLPFALKRS